jgi:hypothetical protein
MPSGLWSRDSFRGAAGERLALFSAGAVMVTERSSAWLEISDPSASPDSGKIPRAGETCTPEASAVNA